MATIIFMFILLVFLVCAVFYLLIMAIQYYPELAKKIELAGYFFLMISLSWGFVAIDLTDMSNGSKDIILNEKLDMIWFLEGKTLQEYEFGETDNSYQYFLDNRDNWRFWTISGDYLNEQVKVANGLNYLIGASSTVFIAAGRLYEIFTPKRNERKIIKGVYRNTRKRKGS